MRVLLSNLAIVTVLATPVLALAAQTATGTVKAFDQKQMSLTLANGSVFQLPKGFHDPGLKAGEKVSIAYDMSGAKHTATSVRILK